MINRLKKIAAVAAHEFKITKFKELHIVHECPNNDFGWVDDKGNVEIRIYRSDRKTRLALSTILDTIAHELAHLIEWDHGPSHRRLTSAIKVWLERNWED
jgi:predicted SprT family Zn-dependent metalloprotease